MSNALEQYKNQPAEMVTSEQITEYLKTFGFAEKLSKNECQQFTEIAKAFNLNPFKKEIYCVAYGEGEKRKLSILTGFEVYLKRAERSGLLDGWKVWTEGTPTMKIETKTFTSKRGEKYTKDVATFGGDLRGIIEIFRKDRNHSFIHEVDLTEYAQDSEIWRTKTRTMIKKVAMAQGFRLCFPDEMGGMPYTEDELPDYMTSERDVTPEKRPEASPAPQKIAPQAQATESTTKPEEPKEKTSEEIYKEKVDALGARVVAVKDLKIPELDAMIMKNRASWKTTGLEEKTRFVEELEKQRDIILAARKTVEESIPEEVEIPEVYTTPETQEEPDAQQQFVDDVPGDAKPLEIY